MIKEAERRVLLSAVAMGTNGWNDPANKAYYLALKQQKAEIDK